MIYARIPRLTFFPMPMNESLRAAVHTAADEIYLSYPDATGVLVLLYYSPSDYTKRQRLHGESTYSQPVAFDTY